MWDEAKRCRFQELRRRELEQTLSEVDHAELTLLVKELEAEEAAYLAPATERLRKERETLETQNRMLEEIARRKEALAKRLRSFLDEAQTERNAIENELAAVLGQDSSTDE